MAVNPNYVYEVQVTGLADQQQIVNIFHYVATANPGPITSTVQDLVAAFALKWVTNVLPALSASYKTQTYECVEIVGGTAGNTVAPGTLLYGSYWLENGNQDAGGQAATFNSTFDAASLRKITAIRSRFARGGCRLGPPADADVVDNQLTAAALTRFQTAANTLDDTINHAAGSTIFTPVVFSKRQTTTQLIGTSVPSVYTVPITWIEVSPNVSSQVSRKRRRGGM